MSQLCRVVEEAKYTSRARRAQAKPQPWIVLKLMVAVTSAILVYAGYVYIGRFTIPIILRHKSFARKGTGVALLVIFCILYLWIWWAYMKIVLTPPGFARDYVKKSPRPLLPRRPSQANSIPVMLAGNIAGPSYEEMPADQPLPAPQPQPQAPPEPKVPIAYSRGPPTTPVLLPEHRYCARDEIVKPYRSHHCRICGTCVLKFDHHCPWIGQCVGARNHKFFINFNLAAFVFTSYTFGTLLGYNVNADGDVDVQEIVIIALSALFAVFTSTLLGSHIWLVWLGQSTVESMDIKNLKERIKYGTFGVDEEEQGCISRPNLKAVRAFREEWGNPDTEGHIWWMGSGRKGWEDVMGTNWLGWFLPIDRPLADGLSYPVNPRFDEQGRWRKRSDWPASVS
ncbi:DHHC palmitoyltransferase-domain-containing protein [Mycena floridula]|nr:DHHC palmitoyltransferase-domain-containing protein [Mycena floridula]